MIGYWGGFEFEVSSNKIYTFEGFGRKSSISIDEQELEGEKPSTYIKGEALEEISMSINLKSDFGIDVKAELERLRIALYNKIPQTFVIGNKPLTQNKWLLINLDETEPLLDNNGNYISIKVNLSFKEWVRGGSKSETKEGKAAAKKAATKGKSKGATTGGVIDKLDGTRYNANAEASKNNSKSTSTVDTQISKPLPIVNPFLNF